VLVGFLDGGMLDLLHHRVLAPVLKIGDPLCQNRTYRSIAVNCLYRPAWGIKMYTLTANEAKTRFGELIDRAQREPVQVTRHNRVVGVMVSAEDYCGMRAFYADRLRHTLKQSAEQAAAKGLTDETLEHLLRDED